MLSLEMIKSKKVNLALCFSFLLPSGIGVSCTIQFRRLCHGGKIKC